MSSMFLNILKTIYPFDKEIGDRMKNVFLLLLLVSFTFIISSQYCFSQNSSYDSLKVLIDHQLQSILGLAYEVGDIIEIDKTLGLVGGRVVDGEIEDPYGKLQHCVLFTASPPWDLRDELRNMVGVFKDGSVLWHSDTLIYGVSGGEIYGTCDLNLDGKVDIITLWNHNRDMWIYSWDGTNGVRLNSQTEGVSEISSVPRQWDFADLDGDGILEIRNLDAEDGSLSWSWNGEEYGVWSNTPHVPFTTWLPAKSATAKISVCVNLSDTLFLYTYTIKSDTTSKRRIKSIHFGNGGITITGNSFNGWKFLGGHMLPFCWDMIGLDHQNFIKPGEQKSEFIAKSQLPPAILKYYVQSERGFIKYNSMDYTLENLLYDITTNSTSGITIGPMIVNLPFDGLNFLDTLNSYTTQSRTLGWITEQSTAEKYTTLFDSAKSQLQRNAIRATRATLDTVLANANRDSSGYLSSEAYALIYFNTEYLLNQLPSPPPQYNLNINVIGNGTVTKSPELALYDSATTVTLTANPSTGYRFSGWSGDVNNPDNPLILVMNSNKNITATFTIKTYTINSTAGLNGTITPSGTVIVNYGSNQTFTITPSQGYHTDSVFVNGNYIGAVGSYTFTNVTSNQTIHAKFKINTYTLTIQPNPNGVVTKNPDQPVYNHGVAVQLTSTPNTGYEFVGWGGDLHQYTDNPITFEMNSNKNISVYYELGSIQLPTFTINVTIAGSGTVTKTPNQPTYEPGTSVILNAKPASGFRFVGWSGDATGTSTKITISMNGNKNITATFVR
ncbi:MAG: hypothetical protein QME58_13400 [Bacteroidota bacterium]|nr:hypothetical protein [Bacteroidota bacterium]